MIGLTQVTRRPWWAALALLAPILGMTALLAHDTVPEQDDVQDLVFLGTSRPVLVRMRIRVNGQPLRVQHQRAEEAYLKALLRQVDRNGDGVLSAEEAALLPPPAISLPPGSLTAQPPVNVAFNFRALDANGDSKVSPDELADYHRRYRGGAFKVSTLPDATSNAAALHEALFNRLDVDQNGKLSREELVAGATSLMELDKDGDELIVPREVSTRLATPETTPRARSQPANSQGSLFVFLNRLDPSVRLAERLLKRYGLAGMGMDGKLTRAGLGLPEALFARLDTNQDGQLEASELAKFADRPADLELIVNLGKRQSSEPSHAIVAAANQVDALNPSAQVTKEGAVVLAVANVRIEFRPNDNRAILAADARQRILQQFKDADADNRGHLERKQADQHNFFPRQFGLLDRNGDGKLEEAELRNYLDEVQETQAKAITSVAAVVITEEGRGLFAFLDRDRDGRLSKRELRSLPTLLEAVESRAAGGLGRDDVPSTHYLAIGLYQASLHPLGVGEAITPPGMPLLAIDWAGDGLGWFRKMDRNGDGDLSPREFLGSKEDFERLDLDRDGLISPDEARRATADGRPTRPGQ